MYATIVGLASEERWRFDMKSMALPHAVSLFVGYKATGGIACSEMLYVSATSSGDHLPPISPSMGRNVALYAIFRLAAIQYPR